MISYPPPSTFDYPKMSPVKQERSKLMVLLTSDSKLIYDIPSQLCEGKQEKNELLLAEDFSVSLQEGFVIEIENYRYRVFHEQKKSIEKHVQKKTLPQVVLPIGTKVYMGKNLGLPLALALPQKVTIPLESKIKLMANTCVQHLNSTVALKLIDETTVSLISV